jgi:hypothetical protein
MHDSYGLELRTMYDSHSVYLRVLWTICMYKFSRCHVIIFHGFFVPSVCQAGLSGFSEQIESD